MMGLGITTQQASLKGHMSADFHRQVISMKKTGYKYVDQFHPLVGAIRHHILDEATLDLINEIHLIFGPFMDVSLEEFEIGFMRDENPNTKVGLWLAISSA